MYQYDRIQYSRRHVLNEKQCINSIYHEIVYSAGDLACDPPPNPHGMVLSHWVGAPSTPPPPVGTYIDSKSLKLTSFYVKTKINIITHQLHIDNNKVNAGIKYGMIINKLLMVQFGILTSLIKMFDNGMVCMHILNNHAVINTPDSNL